MSALDKIAAHQDQYSCTVETLGECKINSPVHHHEFIQEGERIFVSEEEAYMKEMEKKLGHLPTFERAGPLAKIFHDPNWTRVGIVTAGGLCPGLNNVIKGLVEILAFDYGVKNIFGIRFGYAGLNPDFAYQPILLDPDTVDTIHELGGTILGSSRGQQPTDVIVDTLVRMNINVLFCIGGDGSLRCARDVAEECLKRGLKISVVGIPKTIDNDLQFIGRSFGFETAVAEAAFADLLGDNVALYQETSSAYGSVKWDAWRRACAMNNLRNFLTLAVTGSGHGVKSALLAGMGSVAVVNDHVAYQDFGGADETVGALDGATADLILGILRVN